MSPSPKYKRVRSAAGKILAAWNALHKSTETWARPGYRLNMYGQYWKDEDVARVESVYRTAIAEIDDESERFAMNYSLAGLFQQSNRLDDAATLCRSILAKRPAAYNFIALLSRVEAARGNLTQAIELADSMDAIPNSQAFRPKVPELEMLAKSGGVV